MQTCILIYLAAVNGIAFLLCGIDKWKARRERWRIPEKTLFLWSAAGGSLAMFATMLLMRHKTKHVSFMVGIPLIMILQVALLVALVWFGVLPFPLG